MFNKKQAVIVGGKKKHKKKTPRGKQGTDKYKEKPETWKCRWRYTEDDEQTI